MHSRLNDSQHPNDIILQLADSSSLPQLQSNIHSEIFQTAEQIPQALTQNLASDQRVVKRMKSTGRLRDNVFRGFYFQLLRLCFEHEDDEDTKSYTQITKNVIFDRSVVQSSSLGKHLKHLAQFMLSMENDDSPCFEDVLAEYHQVDEAFLAFFVQLLPSLSEIQPGQTNVESILNALCELFEISLIPNHPFYQFEESNVFLYVENDDEMYLIYNQNQEEDQEQEQNSEHQNSQSQSLTSSEHSHQRQNAILDAIFDGGIGQGPKVEAAVLPSAFVAPESNRLQEMLKRDDQPMEYTPPLSPQPKHPSPQSDNAFSSGGPFSKGVEKVNNPYDSQSPAFMPPAPQPMKSAVSFGLTSPFTQRDTPPPTAQKPKPSPEEFKSSISNEVYDGLYADLPANTSGQLNNSKNDTIMNLFGDMAKSGKHEVSVSVSHEETGSGVGKASRKSVGQAEKILEQEEEGNEKGSDVFPNFIKKVNKMSQVPIYNQAKTVNSINENFNSLDNSASVEYSIAEHRGMQLNPTIIEPQRKEKQVTLLRNEPKPLFTVPETSKPVYSGMEPPSKDSKELIQDDDDLFYRPKKSQLKAITEVTSSKETISPYTARNKDDSKGSIYRQFSDTRILKLLKQPHKTKIQLMRNRFKGQHYNI